MYKVCLTCGKKVVIPVTSEKFFELEAKADKIQNIAPDLAPEYREMFVSGICPDCWDVMIGDEPEGGNE